MELKRDMVHRKTAKDMDLQRNRSTQKYIKGYGSIQKWSHKMMDTYRNRGKNMDRNG